MSRRDFNKAKILVETVDTKVDLLRLDYAVEFENTTMQNNEFFDVSLNKYNYQTLNTNTSVDANGNIVTDASFALSASIYVKKGETVYFSNKKVLVSALYGLWDTAGVFKGRVTATSYTATYNSYIRIRFSTSYETTVFMISTIPTPSYVPFYKKVKYFDNITSELDLCLPKTIYSVIGHELNIYKWNVLKCNNHHEYDIQISPNLAWIKILNDRVRILPTTAGTYSVSVQIWKNDVLILYKTISLIVYADVLGSNNTKNLFLGDSLTYYAYPISELLNLCNGAITSYGTVSRANINDADNEARTITCEGRGSWATYHYINSATFSSVSNPFFNNATFDFAYYMSHLGSGFTDVKNVFIMLGTNDIMTYTTADIIARMKVICTSIKAYNAAINIIICLPPPCANDQYGYGSVSNRSMYYFKSKMFTYWKALLDEFEGVVGYYICPININLDCSNDFPSGITTISARNNTTVSYATDTIHPAVPGYYKFSDVYYPLIIMLTNLS